jgi:zinc protease
MIRAFFCRPGCWPPPARAELAIQESPRPGGITAWLVEDHNIPFTALEIQFKGGTSLDAPTSAGQST